MKGRRNRKTTLGASSIRANFHLLNGTEKNRNIAFFNIKQSLPYPAVCEAADFIKKKLPSIRTQLLFGNPIPKSYRELGDLKELPILGLFSEGKLTSVNLVSEINSVLIAIREYKYEINLFLKYKEAFESFLIIGDFESAEKQLSKIETEICYSLWSLENRFLLKELSGKAPENKEFLNYFNEINTSSGITKHVAHYLSLRAEHSLSINRYFSDLEVSMNKMKESSVKEAFKNYYKFKLTYLNHIEFNHYGEIVAIDFPHSVVDRYLNFTKVLSNLLVVSKYLTESDDEEVRNLKYYINNRINYVIRKIDDPVLYKLKVLSGDAIFPAFDVKKSRVEIGIIDNYTVGLYSDAEFELKKLLIENPTQFDIYILYIKTLVYQKKSFTPIGNKKNLQNEILNNIFTIISVETNPDQAALNLLRIANNIASCTLSYGLTDFVHFQIKGRQERKLLSRLSYSIANPIIHDVFNNDNERIHYLSMLKENFPNSITVDFFTEKFRGLDYLLKFKNRIPDGKFRIELARKFQADGDYSSAVSQWEFLVENYRDTSPILETSVINLFQCYLKKKLFDKCIDLFVNSYFFNNHIIDKIEAIELLDLIRSTKFRTVSKSINLPIFYTIIDADAVETHIAFELFNASLNIERPSELLNRIHEFQVRQIMYFLEFTCSPKVLMHSTYINNSKERLEERLSIANYIREKDPNNKSIASEVKSIQNILVIQQGLIDLDESKIYVNEQGIIENELQEFEAIYDRFEIISGIASKNRTFLFLEGGKLTSYSSVEDTELEKIEYSNNPVYDIYIELFNAVKDKFLNSQFGIVAYLSTRIRHGVLVGELRPIFETQKLITLKEGNTSNYRRNVYWDFVYSNFSSEQRDGLQATLSAFASNIDGIIFDLIKKHLQVYSHSSNQDGWFNYEFDSEELWYNSISSIYSTSFDEFVNGIFHVLWLKTDKNLMFIREKIQNETLNKFNRQFDELERKVIEQLGDQNSEPVRKAIKDCSTEIQTVIQKISRWFKRSEIKAVDFSLSELINIVAEYTSKSSWQKRLSLTQEINFDCKIRGQYKTHFADLIRIFLENIIKHSNDSAIDIPCKIVSNLQADNVLEISIENRITDKSRTEELRTIWQESSPDTGKLLSEGKSGYHKAFKILTSDLHCSKHKCLKTKISEDEQNFTVQLLINLKDLTP